MLGSELTHSRNICAEWQIAPTKCNMYSKRANTELKHNAAVMPVLRMLRLFLFWNVQQTIINAWFSLLASRLIGTKFLLLILKSWFCKTLHTQALEYNANLSWYKCKTTCALCEMSLQNVNTCLLFFSLLNIKSNYQYKSQHKRTFSISLIHSSLTAIAHFEMVIGIPRMWQQCVIMWFVWLGCQLSSKHL